MATFYTYIGQALKVPIAKVGTSSIGQQIGARSTGTMPIEGGGQAGVDPNAFE